MVWTRINQQNQQDNKKTKQNTFVFSGLGVKFLNSQDCKKKHKLKKKKKCRKHTMSWHIASLRSELIQILKKDCVYIAQPYLVCPDETWRGCDKISMYDENRLETTCHTTSGKRQLTFLITFILLLCLWETNPFPTVTSSILPCLTALNSHFLSWS